MSIRVMSLVWTHYPEGGSELLLMLALADFANDQGGSIYPAVDTLAAKVRQSPRNVRRLLREIEELGLIKVVANESGGRGLTRHYCIDLKRMQSLHPLSAERVTPAAERVTTEVLKGDKAMSPDTSEPPEPSGPTRATTNKKATTLPKDFRVSEEMRVWANNNVTRTDVTLETEKFIDYHRAKGSTFKCWVSAWRNWMRRAAQYAQEREQKGRLERSVYDQFPGAL